MKLATYIPQGQVRPRVGVLCVHDGVEYLADARNAYALALRHVDHDPCADEIAAARVPADMMGLLAAGTVALQAVRHGLEFAEGALRPGQRPQALIEQGVLQHRSAVKLLAPIPRPGKIVAIGANYHDHIREGRDSGALGGLPSYPPAFLKMSSAVVGPDEPIVYPSFGSELDYEVEFSMVIGKHCRDVRAKDWLEYVAGFTIVNDLSMRDVILEEKGTGIVFAGKNFATACPMGPFIVTKDEIKAPDNLEVKLRVNGEQRQRDRTSSMIHTCAAILSYWSRLGLEPGDVVTTGTPGGGAGFGRKFPERLLKPGDVVEAEVEGIGILRNPVISQEAS
ncbi:MAG: 2-keto-4-pentenoate hydratase/2-oxohepta-3-ene,7-dioic acid hydratase [Ramlibacter sp.]|nr:2-keto-4-pentenoate hydratase/2-oxohepta-3-ene,7-dioic acid hydratase [Ramlibacter sp.]